MLLGEKRSVAALRQADVGARVRGKGHRADIVEPDAQDFAVRVVPFLTPDDFVGDERDRAAGDVAAADLLGHPLADLEARAEKAGRAVQGLAPSKEAAIFNAGPEAAARMSAESKQISEKLGVPIDTVNKTMSSVMSAMGRWQKGLRLRPPAPGTNCFD